MELVDSPRVGYLVVLVQDNGCLHLPFSHGRVELL